MADCFLDLMRRQEFRLQDKSIDRDKKEDGATRTLALRLDSFDQSCYLLMVGRCCDGGYFFHAAMEAH